LSIKSIKQVPRAFGHESKPVYRFPDCTSQIKVGSMPTFQSIYYTYSLITGIEYCEV